MHHTRPQVPRGECAGAPPDVDRSRRSSAGSRRSGRTAGGGRAGSPELRVPRAHWPNGFVERLQKTILHEHWRISFRRQYFTGRRALQRSLDPFLQFYNYERTYRGYRLNGRTPATVFNGAVAA